MANILDYLREVTESFSEKPFCEVDSLILSQLSYLNFAGGILFRCPGAVVEGRLGDPERPARAG